MEKLIVENLSKSFNNNLVFHNVSFELNEGEIIFLTGANGTGKSTMFNILIGWENPDDGEIIYVEDIIKMPVFLRIKNGFAYMPQESFLLENNTVNENIQFAKEALNERYIEPSPEILSLLQNILPLDKISDQRINTLSRGERRKLEFWITLLSKSQVYFFDEPVSGWDLESREHALQIFNILKHNGKSLIVCEHELSKGLNDLCDRIFFISDGIMECFDDKKKFLDSPYYRNFIPISV